MKIFAKALFVLLLSLINIPASDECREEREVVLTLLPVPYHVCPIGFGWSRIMKRYWVCGSEKVLLSTKTITTECFPK